MEKSRKMNESSMCIWATNCAEASARISVAVTGNLNVMNAQIHPAMRSSASAGIAVAGVRADA